MTDNKEALGTSQDAQATTEPFPASPTPEQIAEWEAERCCPSFEAFSVLALVSG